MRHAHGYALILDPDRAQVEYDTIRCCHCQRIVFVKPGSASTVYLFPQKDGRTLEEPGAFCGRCMGPICLLCHDLGRCTPWERQLERTEARDRLRRQILGG